MIRRSVSRLLAAALVLLAAPTGPAGAETRAPLPVEGKTTVFQRVLARPGATLHAAPGGAGGDALRPFQPLYVYGREGAAWIEVGRGRATGPEGWIAADRAVPWDQNIIVSFSNPAGRDRQLMFESEDALMDVVRHESPIGVARDLRRRIETEGAAPGVVTVEPEDHVDITQNFYLFPILEWRVEEHPMTFTPMRVLRLASLPLEESAPRPAPEAPPSVGVVFAIDTTRSMAPYIEATRAAVTDIVDRLRGTEDGAAIRFGAVGFRDSPEAARARDPSRDVEYRTRTYLPLDPAQRPDAVLAGFGGIEEARASTVGVSEDAIAGVVEALGMPGWDTAGPDGGPIRQRFVVVITDASPNAPDDPDSQYDYDPAAVRQMAAAKGVTLATIHVKTPDGIANHRAAEAAYTEMTLRPASGQSLYYPVDLTRGQDPAAAFGPVIEQIAGFVAEERRRTTAELRERQEQGVLTPIEEASLAMRLAWLGRDRNAGAPEVIEAWAIDYALENPLTPALDVRLMMTKNQLSTMASVLREILAIAATTEGESGEGDFFELLRGAFARLAQDPDTLVDTRFETLDEAVGEFLGDLPYQSPLLGVTPDEWASMGSERRAILDRVESRLELYEYFHDDPALWTALWEGAPAGEHVFALPFEALP
jgi:hypothetical protein